MRTRRFLDYLAAIQALLLQRNWGDFKAIIQARKDFNAWKKDFDEQRAQIQAMRTDEVIPQVYDGSILWQYYVKGIKCYKDLTNN